MKNPRTLDQYKVSEGNNQLVLILNSEILLPEDAPVRVTSAQLEELDYRKLYEAYSSKGRKSVTDPRVLFKVMAYQIQLMQEKINKLQNRITLARGMLVLGMNYMDFEGFDPKKIDEYSEQAKLLYGKTDVYKEFTQKSKGRTREQEKDLGTQVMDFFARLGKMRPCEPDCEAAQNWACQLQAFFSEHFYTCTPQILKGLGESYAGGGSMTENIDKAGGAGTGAFAKQVIDAYIES